MGNELVKFTFETIPVRVTTVNGDPWFVANDVCNALGILRGRDAVGRLDDDEKGAVSISTLGGNQDLICVSESGVYSLVMGSRKPEAKKFKRWVTHEVIPSIRKTGMYAIKSWPLPSNYSEALRWLANEVDRSNSLQARVDEMAPKEQVFDALVKADGNILVRDFAKHYKLKVQWLYDWLKEKNILFYNSQENLVPYAKYADAGYFVMRKSLRKDKETTDSTPYLTNKGCVWLTKGLIKNGFMYVEDSRVALMPGNHVSKKQ